MLSKILSAKVAAIAAAVLASTGTAAAATGSLPGPAQNGVSKALAHVGVSVPGPNSHAANHGPSGAKGPDATGNAKFGLCTAWAAAPPTTNSQSQKSSSVAFSNVQKAAAAAGMSVEDFCKGVTPPKHTDEPTTGPTGHTGPTGSHAPVTVPNSGGTGTADTASGGASSTGTNTAGNASAGHSTSGSGNGGAGTTHRP